MENEDKNGSYEQKDMKHSSAASNILIVVLVSLPAVPYPVGTPPHR